MKLPANWKTTFSGIGAAIFGLLTIMAALPAQVGDLSTIIPEKYKSALITIGLIGGTGLKIWNSVAQKSKEVTGGSVQQTISGAKADPGTQTLVDQTLVATKKSGEEVSSEQQEVLNALPGNNQTKT
jgi:hypothetical protein